MTGIAFSAPGDFDKTFGGDGVVTYPISYGDECVFKTGVALQKDGKIVVMSNTYNGENCDIVVLRYNSDGTLDNTFDEDGIVTYNSGANDSSNGVAIQQDGKIVVVGSTYNGTNYDTLVLRYNSDGTLDSTFDEDGIVTYNSGANDSSNGVAIQQDGKIVVVGNGYDADRNIVISRYNIDGTLDNTFGIGGIITYNDSSICTGRDINYCQGNGIALKQDGKIVVVGTGMNGAYFDVFVLRFESNGTLDNTFGTNGVVTYQGISDGGSAVAIQPDGKIVLVGESHRKTIFYDVLILRYNNNGTLDATFGGDGVVKYRGMTDHTGNGVTIQIDGKIVVIGSGRKTDTDLLVLRYNSDGTLDTTFGGDGVVTYSSTANSHEIGYGVVIQQDEKIVITGNMIKEPYAPFKVLTMRLIGQKVNLLAPNGGENIPSASTYRIEWTAPAEAVSFKLSYSIDNGMTWVSIPGANNLTERSYIWTVPKPWGNQKQCLVKVIGYDSSGIKIGGDISDAPFTIEVVKLESPNGGVTYTSGDPLTITWTTNGTKRDVAKVKLYYTKDGGTTWNKITREDGNPGSYQWQVPCVKKDKASYKVKVILLDESGNIVGEDVSNGYFTIVRTCTDISGNWDGTDKITVTCEYNGQSESGTFTGSATIFINQNDCEINWTIPDTNVKRSGTIWCNKFSVSGKFCRPEMLPGAIFSTNQLTASGTVDGDTINLIGWGQCSGTYQGVNFSCYGRDKTVLTRSLFGITEEKRTAQEPRLFMNKSLRIFSTISP
jgi:uncharacterized delta-60 repeat protein